MAPPPRNFLTETRKTLVRLVAYFVLLGAIGYGSVTLLGAGLAGAFAAHDNDLGWMRPASAGLVAAEKMIHPSLKPKLRGSIEE